MENHVRVLGILYIVFGVMGLIAALIILAVFGGIAGIVATAGQAGDADTQTAVPILGVIGGAIFVFLLVMSLPGIITGIGLLQYKEWARILGIILSALNLPGVPIGTALGVYGLWVLLNNETVRLFQNPPNRVVARGY